MTKTRYPWNEWFATKEFVLTSPRDFRCAPQSMVAQLRFQASQRGVYVSVNVLDKALLCNIHTNPSRVALPAEDQVGDGNIRYPWVKWLGREGEYTLTQGQDYHCRSDVFAQQFRNIAAKLGKRVSLVRGSSKGTNWVKVRVRKG